MKTLLILDYYFPPLIADWRGIALAKYLPESGWRPVIISSAESTSYQKDYSLLAQIPPGTEVHRLSHPETPHLWQSLRSRLRAGLDFPDRYRGWIAPALSAARGIIRSGRVDLLYSISPTFATALAAGILKRESGLPWVADFLDGWAVNDFLSRSIDQSLARPFARIYKHRIRKAEHGILESADRTLVISWHVRERLRALHGTREDKIIVINDGYDESVFQDLTPRRLRPERLTITFLGSHYADFEEPLADFLEAARDALPEAELLFIGRCAPYLERFKSRLGIPNLTAIGHLPREEALAYGLGSDFLFEVMPAYAKWIPTKTYDYLRLGRPILGLVPADGDAARIIREARAGIILPFGREKLRAELARIGAEWRSGAGRGLSPDREYISRYERRVLVRKAVEVLDQLTPARR